MLSVLMSGNQDFKAMKNRKPFREFPGDFIGQLRRNHFIRSEGLNKMLVCPSACFVIKPFGHLHFLPDCIRVAV